MAAPSPPKQGRQHTTAGSSNFTATQKCFNVLQCLSMSNLRGSSVFVDVNYPKLHGPIGSTWAMQATCWPQLTSSMFVDVKSVGLLNFCRCQLSKASRADLLHMSSAGRLLSPIEFFNCCRCQFRGVPECLSMSTTLSFSDRLASCKSCRPPTVSD